MIVLDTICHKTIWGGERLARYLKTNCKKIGHLYSVYCREEISNTILNGKYAGKTLNEVFPLWREEFGMDAYPYFPLTIALTEADSNLSIQVHPNDETASILEHCARGKRESWYFLEAPYDGYIMNGCVCQNEDEKEEMLSKRKYLEMVDTLPVSVGDYVFVHPGTLHSITAGSLVYEIEEGADFTYRFYDYDRIDGQGKKRELHIDKASKALDIFQKSLIKHYPDGGEIWEETYITKKISNTSSYKNLSSTLECFTLVFGKAECDGVAIRLGMSVLLWPGEEITGADIKLGFIAKLRGDIQ
ncbi:type I phosphomannose isomerase catalytic subunit [Flavonifractor sp. An306]|uniref:type I phosphomannose isomerase catalytic subunit n=1 Tax=Flavonifractor sp. An306 TaxID=1965629 RepID=UPI000B3A840A|nr:type I phosphomannose isomerase catalytic subunit [Flavonifractor sp. An306]OUO38221.1 hypothetical protein B5F88_11860 [Flavonifractor sp. An306]